MGKEIFNKSNTWILTTENPPSIIIDNNAEEPLTFAAAELKRYLEQILNTQLPNSSSDRNIPCIYLSINSALDLTNEGYEFHGEGKTFYITGGGPLGVVFGVYEFLRRHCGCKFSDLGTDGEYIPRHTFISVPSTKVQQKPVLWYRALQQFEKEDAETARLRIDWMAKNGLNYIMYTPGICGKEWFDRELLPDIRRRGLKLDMNHHNLCYWLPPDKYLKEHPEWYALVDGERGKSLDQLCICTSNQDAVNELINNVCIYLRENPEVKSVGIIVEDGYGMCQCERCISQDENREDAFRRGTEENRSKSRRYAKLINKVAKAIRTEFPDILVGGAAYVDLLWPPHDTALEANTNIWVALYWRDGARPIAPNNTSDKNIHFFDVLRNWQDVYSGRLTVYEYYMGMLAQLSLPYPQWEVICKDWKYLKSLGVGGATIQCMAECHCVYSLNLLAFARSAWENEVDSEKLLSDYLEGAFGSIAEQLRPVFFAMRDVLRKIADEKKELYPYGDNVCLFLDDHNRLIIRQALVAAQKNVTDAREKRQLEKLTGALKYWILAADFFTMRDKLLEVQKSDKHQAVALFEQLESGMYSELKRYLQTSTLSPGWVYNRISLLRRWQKQIDTIRKDIGEQSQTANPNKWP